uniref:Chitin-binding type-2 domain-containing protein n=1 Tax=Timema poppense TaxID=170557 RepID=A0A7R9HCE5_TIMPO|nr:unnamed protein product [Timema poppensis]
MVRSSDPCHNSVMPHAILSETTDCITYSPRGQSYFLSAGCVDSGLTLQHINCRTLALNNNTLISAQDTFKCPDDYGFYPHSVSCDKYFKCDNGVAELKTCGNGLAFDASDPKYLTENCDYLHNTDCGDRAKLALCMPDRRFTQARAPLSLRGSNQSCVLRGFNQSCFLRGFNQSYFLRGFNQSCSLSSEPPITAPHCPRLYGIFADEAKCDTFWNCWNGEASRYQCSPGLAYDREARVCMWADQVPECKTEEVANGFVCPAAGELSNVGSFSRHAHPEDCRKYYICTEGVARELGCPIGTVFKIGDTDGSGNCEDPEDVPGCEDYYGDLDLKTIRKSELLAGLQSNGQSRNAPAPKSAASKPRPQASPRPAPQQPRPSDDSA